MISLANWQVSAYSFLVDVSGENTAYCFTCFKSLERLPVIILIALLSPNPQELSRLFRRLMGHLSGGSPRSFMR